MKKAIYVFSVLLVALSIGTNYVKGQYSYTREGNNFDEYVSGLTDSWYYNKATQKCVKGSTATVGTTTYSTEQKCKDANKSNVPIVSIPDKDDPKNWVPIFYTPPVKPEPKVTTGTPFSTPQWSQPQGAPSGLQGLSFFPTATTTDKKPAFNFSFNDTETKIFGVTPRENMFLDNKKPDQPAKTGLFSFILDSLTFNKGSNLQVQPTIEPLSEGQPATGYQFATTTGIFGDEVLTYQEPENKGIIAKLLEGLGIGRGVDAPVATITPSGANIPGDKSPILDTSKIDSVTDNDVTVMSDDGTGEPGECGPDKEKTILKAVKSNDISTIEKCAKLIKSSGFVLTDVESISPEAAEALVRESFFDTLMFNSARLIYPDVAENLVGGNVKYLWLDGLTLISSGVARNLTNGNVEFLSLKGLTSIDNATAIIFKNFEAKGGRLDVTSPVREIINSAKDSTSGLCTITAVSLIQKDKDNADKKITKTGNNFLIELDKDLKIKITLGCEADNPIVKGSRLQAYFGSVIGSGKTKTFDTNTKEFTQEFTFTPDELPAQKNIIERPGVLNVKFYDFATKEESSQIRPLGILFNEKTEQELKLCYKIGSEEKCLEGKNSAFGHIKASKDKSIDFKWEAKNFDLCWLANPKDVRVELTGSRTMASRQSDFENFGITCKYTKIDRKEIHQTLMFQIESESKTDDKFNFSIKDNNKDISCKGPVEFSWDIGKNWTKCEKIEPAEKTYFDSKDWNIKAGEKGSITVNLKENKTDKTQDLVFGIKCYQGDQDTKGEEKRIQVNLSKCETPKERNTAQCTNEANGKPKACDFSVDNSYTKTVVLNSRDNPGEGAITGRFNISGCNWPASDQPIYLKARIIIDGREILLPQTGQKIESSLKRDWVVKFSDIYEEGRNQILNTLWDEQGKPKLYNGKEISGAPVNFTIKVDQCIDKECTQTCSQEKSDVIQAIYVRREALSKHALTVNSNEQTKFKLTRWENGREGNVLKEATTSIKKWNLSDLSQGTYILYVQKPNDHNVLSSGWENSKDHQGFVWQKIKLEGDRTVEIKFEKTGTSPTPPPASNTNTTYVLTITEGETVAYANGTQFNLPTAVEKKNNVVFAPIASIVRKFGGKVDWERVDNKIDINFNGRRILSWSGEEIILVETKKTGVYETNLPKPYIKNGNFMVPIVEFSKALGIGSTIQEKTLNKHPQEPGNTNPEPPKQTEDISEKTKPIPQGSVSINIKNNKCEFLNIIGFNSGDVYYKEKLGKNQDQILSFILSQHKTSMPEPAKDLPLRVELQKCTSNFDEKNTFGWTGSRDWRELATQWRILGKSFTLNDVYDTNENGFRHPFYEVVFK